MQGGSKAQFADWSNPFYEQCNLILYFLLCEIVFHKIALDLGLDVEKQHYCTSRKVYFCYPLIVLVKLCLQRQAEMDSRDLYQRLCTLHMVTFTV